jgi:hypothetical protein
MADLVVDDLADQFCLIRARASRAVSHVAREALPFQGYWPRRFGCDLDLVRPPMMGLFCLRNIMEPNVFKPTSAAMTARTGSRDAKGVGDATVSSADATRFVETIGPS